MPFVGSLFFIHGRHTENFGRPTQRTWSACHWVPWPGAAIFHGCFDQKIPMENRAKNIGVKPWKLRGWCGSLPEKRGEKLQVSTGHWQRIAGASNSDPMQLAVDLRRAGLWQLSGRFLLRILVFGCVWGIFCWQLTTCSMFDLDIIWSNLCHLTYYP